MALRVEDLVPEDDELRLLAALEPMWRRVLLELHFLVQDTLPVSCSTRHKLPLPSDRRISAITRAPKAPTPPASVGVKKPPYSPPSTNATKAAMGRSFDAI